MKKLISLLAVVSFLGVIGCESMDPSSMMGPGKMGPGKKGCPFKKGKTGETGETGETKGKMDMSKILEMIKGIQKSDDPTTPSNG